MYWKIFGVARLGPHRVPAPVYTKSALVDALGDLALSCAPAVPKAVLQALQAMLSCQPASTKVLIETRDGKFNFEFDPKKISLQELVGAAGRLGGSPTS